MIAVTDTEVSTLPSGAIDMTPGAVGNWGADSPVLFVSPGATVHQKIALAWSMVSELETMAEAACCRGAEKELMRGLCEILWGRSASLKMLLEELGAQTSVRGGSHG